MNRELGENERIVRYISPRYMGESGVSARAFCLRQDRPEEKGLSVNWLGVLGVGERRQLAEIRCIFGTKFEVRRSGRFAEMRVGDVLRRVCEHEQVKLRVLHTPEEAGSDFGADPSHAQIFGLPHPRDDRRRAERIGTEILRCVVALHKAVED